MEKKLYRVKLSGCVFVEAYNEEDAEMSVREMGESELMEKIEWEDGWDVREMVKE